MCLLQQLHHAQRQPPLGSVIDPADRDRQLAEDNHRAEQLQQCGKHILHQCFRRSWFFANRCWDVLMGLPAGIRDEVQQTYAGDHVCPALTLPACQLAVWISSKAMGTAKDMIPAVYTWGLGKITDNQTARLSCYFRVRCTVTAFTTPGTTPSHALTHALLKSRASCWAVSGVPFGSGKLIDIQRVHLNCCFPMTCTFAASPLPQPPPPTVARPHHGSSLVRHAERSVVRSLVLASTVDVQTARLNYCFPVTCTSAASTPLPSATTSNRCSATPW